MTGGRPKAARVRRSGLALVHEGEYVVARAGAEALFDGDGMGAAAEARPRELRITLPVEIEIVGSGGPELDALTESVLRRLHAALDAVDGE